mmetsp:Transcript_16842/g.42915  ORF Transcript_16842/g.42915 Transcript_16842/m.42915 type:complete len:640 (+) Transcript_16842:35-1954(+)
MSYTLVPNDEGRQQFSARELRSVPSARPLLSSSDAVENTIGVDKSGRPVQVGQQVQHRVYRNVAGCAINPAHPVCVGWSALLLLLLVFDVVFQPINMAFNEAHEHAWGSEFDEIVHVVLLVDMVFQFFIQVPSEDGMFWRWDCRVIATAYVCSYDFLLDCISVFPFYQLAVIHYGSDAYRSFWIGLLRGTHMCRYFRFNRLWQRCFAKGSMTYTETKLVQTTLILLAAVHILACTWAAAAKWALSNNIPKNWLNKFLTAYGIEKEDEASEPVIYLYAVYWAIYTLTSAGYGDITPATHVEYCVGVVGCLLAGAVWCYFTAEIVTFVSLLAARGKAASLIRDSAKELCSQYSFGVDLRMRLLAFFEMKVQADEQIRTRLVIKQMSPALQIATTKSIYMPFVKQISWMDKFGGPALVDCVQRLDQLLLIASEVLRDHKCLYFVMRGLVIVGPRIRRKGNTWGDDLILQNDELRHRYDALALSPVETTFLSRAELDNVLRRYPAEQKIVRRRRVMLAMMRRLISQAKEAKAAGETRDFMEFNKAPRLKRKQSAFLKPQHLLSEDELLASIMDGIMGTKKEVEAMQLAQRVHQANTEDRLASLEMTLQEIQDHLDPPPADAYASALTVLTDGAKSKTRSGLLG